MEGKREGGRERVREGRKRCKEGGREEVRELGEGKKRWKGKEG